MNVKKLIEKYYYYLFLSVSVFLIGYTLYAIYNGEITLCSRGPACTEYDIDKDRSGFISVSLIYLFIGVFFLYLYFRERKKP